MCIRGRRQCGSYGADRGGIGGPGGGTDRNAGGSDHPVSGSSVCGGRAEEQFGVQCHIQRHGEREEL